MSHQRGDNVGVAAVDGQATQPVERVDVPADCNRCSGRAGIGYVMVGERLRTGDCADGRSACCAHVEGQSEVRLVGNVFGVVEVFEKAATKLLGLCLSLGDGDVFGHACLGRGGSTIVPPIVTLSKP